MEKINLTPKGYIPGPLYQLLDEQPDSRWITFECGEGNTRRRFTMTLQEIANVLQVKALIDALEKAKEQIRHDNEGCAEYRAIDAEFDVSEWESFMPTVWDEIKNALAPFKDKE